MAAAHLRGYFLGYLRHLLEKVTKHFKMLNVKDSLTIFFSISEKMLLLVFWIKCICQEEQCLHTSGHGVLSADPDMAPGQPVLRFLSVVP